MSRRFLYMVVGNCSFAPSLYTLHRINPSALFYPKDSPDRAAAAAAACMRSTTMEAAAEDLRARKKAMRESRLWPKSIKADGAEEARLPVASMNFSTPGIAMDFALIGRSKDKIVALDGENPDYTGNNWEAPGRAVLYDDAAHSVRAQLCNRLPDRDTVPVAVGDNVYFMGEEEGVVPSKENLRALIRYPTREPDIDSDWYWYSFPPPPYDVIGTGEHDPRPHYPERRDMLGAYAVVGESHIWASTRIRGTFSMDTASGTWSRASDSPLPFSGRAEYAPEHGLWFGFPNDEWQYDSDNKWRYESGDSDLLCAWDLNSVESGGAAAPLRAHGVWEGGFGAPSWSFNVRSHLLHLGDGGRFCVAKLYQTYEPVPPGACSRCYNDGTRDEISFAVLTGVEVERCDNGELRMVKHRSCKYSFGEYSFPQDVL
ncbi:hypothetical protein QYE76_020304 [Lolium multiflorum]|uniref:Uncharacterized protein n=1 Tax=Lolium multiflorum TaxID=4521 RepID=A0AAD8R6S3_LOLMU|nr:hypothetical protein QYE76_020304 [Lolium multiflorum]